MAELYLSGGCVPLHLRNRFTLESPLRIKMGKLGRVKGIKIISVGGVKAKNSISIGKHVWIGATAVILKGVESGDNSIMGNSSVVTSGQYESNTVYAGIPAMKIKSGINWCH